VGCSTIQGIGDGRRAVRRERLERGCATIRHGMYRWVEHTAEVELAIEAATEREVFADALAALADLLGVGGERGANERRTLSAAASDRAALLAAWLEELLFLAELEGFEAVSLESLELAPCALEAEVAGRLGHPPPLVKGVTYHRLAFEPTTGGYRARVVLDV
jgi:SHS2 domain-containing protein